MVATKSPVHPDIHDAGQAVGRDLYPGADIGVVDPDLQALISFEEERQAGKLILIPSACRPPRAVLQALGSPFAATGAGDAPPLRATREQAAAWRDFADELARRRGRPGWRQDGVDSLRFLEWLAQRRAADCFATENAASARVRAALRPLSGAAAVDAACRALLGTGDTVMGMDTGRAALIAPDAGYRAVGYGVSKTTGRLDYDAIRDLARAHRPRLIIAGGAPYTWMPDWRAFADIAHEVGAWLLADIGQTAGLVAAGACPSPVGIADVVTLATDGTLCGPPGAAILCTDDEVARRIDLALARGTAADLRPQHMAALAVTFAIARSDAFRRLQQRIGENAVALADGLQRRGLRLAYGGTDTHFCVLDLNGVRPARGEAAAPLRAEPAARILDLAGIVAAPDTIPGDTSAALAMGIRLGTPWLSQRGFGPAEMDEIAGLIQKTIAGIQPFSYMGLTGELPGGKIELDTLEEIKAGVAALVASGAGETADRAARHSDASEADARVRAGAAATAVLLVSGERAAPGLAQILTSDVAALAPGEQQFGLVLDPDGCVMAEVGVLRLAQDERGRDRFVLALPPAADRDRLLAWLRGLSEGYILFDRADLFARVEGPLAVEEVAAGELGAAAQALAGQVGRPGLAAGTSGPDAYRALPGHFELRKPYFIGHRALDPVRERPALPEFRWEAAEAPLQRTPLFDWHKAHTRHIVPFAGWEMPVWYSGVLDEHNAVRKAAGLFDVAHMGVFEIAGPHATEFLDLVCTNAVRPCAPGESLYGYFLDPDGRVIDDLMIYRRASERYLMVVNAANADKDWAWLNAVNDGQVLIDRERPAIRVLRPATLRNLKDPGSGPDMRVDLALQGPASLRILQSLADDGKLRDRLGRLRRTGLLECDLAGFDLIIARTGYTGEEIAYEIFVHPERAVALWETLLRAGEPFGLQPAGLAARDSTRTEAGLPLYGHELAGRFDISPAGAGFPSYVKLSKPYFIGRSAYLAREKTRAMEVVRFRMNRRGVRMPKTGDPVVNDRGQAIGWVTSAAVDVDGVILGMAYVGGRYARPGDEIGIINLPAKPLIEKPNKADLEPGDKIALPDAATILRRFPDAAERAHWRAAGG